MAGDPKPHEPRSTNDVLNVLRSMLTFDGPFHLGLLSSFHKAQSALLLQRVNKGETLPIEYQQIFAYESQSPESMQLMQGLFNQKLELVRLERPVALLDVQRLVQEKINSTDGNGISYDDLLFSVSNALSSSKQCQKDENGLFPQIEAHYVPYDKRDHSHRDLLNEDNNAELAFIWGDTNQSGPEFRAFDSLMLRLSDSKYQRTTSILLPESATKKGGYGSPWVPKLQGTQLAELDSNKISRTVAKTWSALTATDSNKIRVVVRPYGTGKTTMLQELKKKLTAEGIPEVTFISGSEQLETQLSALNGEVIFVDEAVNLDVIELAQKIKKTSIIILFYPTEEVMLEKMPEALWPKGTYTLKV